MGDVRAEISSNVSHPTRGGPPILILCWSLGSWTASSMATYSLVLNFSAATMAFIPTLLTVNSSSEVRYAGFMVVRIRPIFAAANWVSAHSAQLGDQMP